MLSDVGIKRVEMVRSIDGDEMLAAGGRCYRVNNRGLFKMMWDKDGKREKHMCHVGKNWRMCYPWGTLGCNLSHQKALKKAREIMEGGEADMVLIVEDDAVQDMPPQQLRSVFHQAVNQLAKSSPAWTLLLLGGTPQTRFANQVPPHGPSGVKGLRRSEAVYQAHAFIVRLPALDHLEEKLQAGLAADGATVSYQKATATKRRCFHFHPPLFRQLGSLGSDIQKASEEGSQAGYNNATAKRHAGAAHGNCKDVIRCKQKLRVFVRNRLGRGGTGCAPVSKTIQKVAKRQQAAVGGLAFAGNGSDQKNVAKKVMWMQHWRDVHEGNWPSCKVAKKAKNISYNLWKRIRT